MSNNTLDQDKYLNWSHRFGRIGTLIALLYMIAVPLIVSSVYDIFPDLPMLALAGISVMAIFMPIGISEALSYTPILGSSTYLTFLTGNIMNLKLPCVINAQKLAKADQNTPEGDAIATVAVATSSILTVLIISLGALFLVPLQPILQAPVVQQATQYMLPALFGGLALGILASSEGKMQIKNKLLAVVIPVAIVSGLILAGIVLPGMEGILILAMLPITILSARIFWKKGLIRVVDKSEQA